MCCSRSCGNKLPDSNAVRMIMTVIRKMAGIHARGKIKNKGGI